MRIVRDERLALVNEQEDSGKSAPVICLERGIGCQIFLHWKKTRASPWTPDSPAFVESVVEINAHGRGKAVSGLFA